MEQAMNIDAYVKKAKQENIPLIDVRDPEDFEEGHIPGAVNIPLRKISHSSVKPGSYLYCVTGYHAGMAHEILRREGIDSVNIGGIENYTGKLTEE